MQENNSFISFDNTQIGLLFDDSKHPQSMLLIRKDLNLKMIAVITDLLILEEMF